LVAAFGLRRRRLEEDDFAGDVVSEDFGDLPFSVSE